VRTEPETRALRDFLAQHLLRLTSALSIVEVSRAAMRHGTRAERDKAEEVMEGVVVVKLTPEMLDLAATLEPATLRSLDAIHLATALHLIAEQAVEISHFVVYDHRLAVAARDAGFSAVSPGS
jgi:predicted nucleic acid-binding protein